MSKEKAVQNQKTQETIQVPVTVIEEEIYSLEEDSSLIQYEMNMIELPFFTRDKNIGIGVGKKYIFAKDLYMEVTPPSTAVSGYKIPQEFDEKIFYSILQVYRKQKSSKIITTMYELLNIAGYGKRKKDYDRLHESLDRLRGTQFVLKGIFYDKNEGKRITDRVNVGIIQDSAVREIEDLNKEEKEILGRETPKKSVVVIELSSFMKNNIESKGFLYYDSEKLIELKNSTARKLYLLMSKWQGWEKKSRIRRSCYLLASRIPLSWDRTNIPGTINVLEKAAKDLEKKRLIGSFSLERHSPLSDSVMEFNFEGAEETARTKRIREENEKLSTTTGHEYDIMNAVEKTEHEKKEIVQEGLWEISQKEHERKLEQEKKKEEELKKKARKIISEMPTDRLEILKKEASEHPRYSHEKIYVRKGEQTEKEALEKVMVFIISQEIRA